MVLPFFVPVRECLIYKEKAARRWRMCLSSILGPIAQAPSAFKSLVETDAFISSYELLITILMRDIDGPFG